VIPKTEAWLVVQERQGQLVALQMNAPGYGLIVWILLGHIGTLEQSYRGQIFNSMLQLKHPERPARMKHHHLKQLAVLHGRTV